MDTRHGELQLFFVNLQTVAKVLHRQARPEQNQGLWFILPQSFLVLWGCVRVSRVGTDPSRGGASNRRNVARRVASRSAGQVEFAQIFEHLLLSYTSTTKGALKAMQIGKPLGSRPSLRDRISTFYVSGLGFMPEGRTAPEQTTPKDGAGIDSLRQFNDALVAMDATLADAEKRFGSRVNLLDHPVLGPLTAQQWRAFSPHSRQASL